MQFFHKVITKSWNPTKTIITLKTRCKLRIPWPRRTTVKLLITWFVRSINTAYLTCYQHIEILCVSSLIIQFSKQEKVINVNSLWLGRFSRCIISWNAKHVELLFCGSSTHSNQQKNIQLLIVYHIRLTLMDRVKNMPKWYLKCT